MLRYLALHEANNTQLCCRTADFAAFIATVTIVLSFLDTSYHHKTDVHQQDEADKNLVQQIVDAMESLSRSSREKIAAQSVKVMKTLLTTQSTSGPTAENLRLTLPFFGTVYISRGLSPNNTPDSNEAASTPVPTHLTTSQYQQSIQNTTQHQPMTSQHASMQD